MVTHLFTHRDCLFHDTGTGHPERADRLRMVLHKLDGEEFADLVWHEATLAERELIELVHDRSYVDEIEASYPDKGITSLDPDTYISPGSRNAALRSVGAVRDAVDLVMTTEDTNAFCAIRPPGHHAERDAAMGFCLFNNIAIGAFYARQKYNVKRVAVIDFDVHHGNGTQAMFENEPDFLYISSHQEAPFYPGTGFSSETGIGENVLNLPLPSGAGSHEFRVAMEDQAFPKLEAFSPEILFISAGFDAHARDDRANMFLTEDDYQWISKKLVDIAWKSSNGRLISVLEGGYDLVGLANSAEIHVKALLEA